MSTDLKFQRQGRQVTDSDLAGFEKWLGVGLPAPYRTFLQRRNGGRPSDENCALKSPPHLVVNSIMSLDDDDESRDLRENVQSAWKRKGIPKELIKVAFDDGGGYFLLGVKGDHAGEVWFYRPESDDGPKRGEWSTRKAYRKLATTFDEFLGMLGPIKP